MPHNHQFQWSSFKPVDLDQVLIKVLNFCLKFLLSFPLFFIVMQICQKHTCPVFIQPEVSLPHSKFEGQFCHIENSLLTIFFPFITLNMLLQCLLVSVISGENPVTFHIINPLYVMHHFCLAAFKILSLSFSDWTTMCLGQTLLVFSFLVEFRGSVSQCFSLNLGKILSLWLSVWIISTDLSSSSFFLLLSRIYYQAIKLPGLQLQTISPIVWSC